MSSKFTTAQEAGMVVAAVAAMAAMAAMILPASSSNPTRDNHSTSSGSQTDQIGPRLAVVRNAGLPPTHGRS
jgi:hypothetical protein